MGLREIPGDNVPFSRFGWLLPGLMLLLLPALGVMYLGKVNYWGWVYKAGSIGVIAIIICASAVIIVSGIIGAIERAKYRRLSAGINTEAHRRPRGY